MNVQFLCATHKQQLSTNKTQALRCWRNAYEAGQTFVDMQLPLEALPHLGCAYEVAEIILSKQMLEDFDGVVLLATSTASLAKCYLKMGEAAVAKDIIELTVSRLNQEKIRNKEILPLIQHQIDSLLYSFQKKPDVEPKSNKVTMLFQQQQYFEQLEQRVVH